MAHRDSNLEAKPERDLKAAIEHTFRLVQQDEQMRQRTKAAQRSAAESFEKSADAIRHAAVAGMAVCPAEIATCTKTLRKNKRKRAKNCNVR